MTARSTSYKPSGSQTRPWLRWAARSFDFFLFSFLVGIVLELIYPSALNIPALDILLIFVYVFVEPTMLCSWGTTPGKALFKIRLRRQNETKLNYLQALSRSFSVWIKGLGLGVPFISLFTLLNSYNCLTNEGITSWDRDGGFSVSHQIISLLRTILIVLLFLLFLVPIAVRIIADISSLGVLQ
ncbi:RDD family protein [Phormidium sp. FACHB-592]|uniref:RDD family protein n=1 Tax=Stenomitos frigidus AS-A4 TaxID=2933935 RepID=A0ABV0KG95_9CYAN|nr:RDD family protein [Phormidium sp. FACHB-592]MBD2078050.1 RDD family protein [Phormidium sp. FACHB-592]